MRKNDEKTDGITVGMQGQYCVCKDCPIIVSLAEQAANDLNDLVESGILASDEAGYYLNLIGRMSYTADDEIAIWALIALFETAGKEEEEIDRLFEYIHICEFADGDAYKQFMEAFFSQKRIDDYLLDDKNKTIEGNEPEMSQR